MPPSERRVRARQRGADGESQAAGYLAEQGLVLVDAGWRCRLGELDLVMLADGILVFVEVRARQAGGSVSAIESIDSGKQSRWIRAARAWLAFHPEHERYPARFDIVAIEGTQLHWLRDVLTVQRH